MKRIAILISLVLVTLAGFSQSLWRPVPLFPTESALSTEVPITHKWAWRLDATFALKEVNYNKVTKDWITTDFSAVGLAIGYQNFVPTSTSDPTPKNNFGAAVGLALGRNIVNPNLAELKVLAEVIIWEYFKIGGTFTPNPPTDISKLGVFFGGGITF